MNIDTEFLVYLDTLLSKLWAAGAGDAAVAGGAIRDMLFDKPIKDIDVFYTGEISFEKLKKTWGFSNIVYNEVSYPNTNSTLVYTLTWSSFPVPIQLIHCSMKISEIINTFPANIGRCYYDEKGLHGINGDVILSANDKIVWFEQPTSYKYYMKYKEKYSDWKLKFCEEDDKPPELKVTELPGELEF